LPAPLGPISPKIPRAGTDKLNPRSTCNPPKFFAIEESASITLGAPQMPCA